MAQSMEQVGPLPRSMSGKKATVVMLVVLLTTGGLFYWVISSYGAYNAARRQTERDWRELATQLDIRYRALDACVVAEARAQALDASLAERWQATRQLFTGTALSRNQIQAAKQLEDLVSQLPETVRASGAIAPPLAEALAAYTSSANHQRQLGREAGSQLLKSLLVLPDPTDLELSAESGN